MGGKGEGEGPETVKGGSDGPVRHVLFTCRTACGSRPIIFFPLRSLASKRPI